MERFALDSACEIHTGALPDGLAPAFEELWNLHPEEYPEIHLHGRRVKTPRWQQAFGADYHFSGTTSRASAVPSELEPLLAWVKDTIFSKLNGLLLNWYDGSLGHYIGEHHDSTTHMIADAPIVTVSFGEARKFRMRHPKTGEVRDFVAEDGSVIVIPYATNLVWKHAVPKSTKYVGRRVSVTMRAFEET